MLIPSLVDQFRNYLLAERAASLTNLRAYTETLARLLGFLDSEDLAPAFGDIATHRLRRFVAALNDAELGNASIARHVHAVRSFWRFVVETYDLPGNPSLPIRAPRPDHRVPHTLTVDECQRLLEAAGSRHFRLYRVRDRVLLKLMMVVGLRRSEVVSLRISDYIPDERALRVVMSKGRRSRVVLLSRDLCEDVDAWLRVRPKVDHDHLLTTRTGHPLTTKCLYTALRGLADLAGLSDRQIAPHMLRHTAATQVLRASGDLLATSRLLGHSSVSVTGDVYCHLTDDDVRRAVSFHPLVQASRPASPLDPRAAPGEWSSSVEDDAISEAERMVERALAEHRRAVAGDSELADRRRDQCIVEAIRHNARNAEEVPAGVVRAVAWEGRVVEAYTMAEHMRMVALKDVFVHLPELAQSQAPWSDLLADVAGRLSGIRAPTLDGKARIALDDFGARAMAEEALTLPALQPFTQTLGRVAMLDAFGEQNLLLSQIAANLAGASRSLPVVLFAFWQTPLLRAALGYMRHGQPTALASLLASRICEACESPVAC